MNFKRSLNSTTYQMTEPKQVLAENIICSNDPQSHLIEQVLRAPLLLHSRSIKMKTTTLERVKLAIKANMK